jgi:hypothetical protein
VGRSSKPRPAFVRKVTCLGVRCKREHGWPTHPAPGLNRFGAHNRSELNYRRWEMEIWGRERWNAESWVYDNSVYWRMPTAQIGLLLRVRPIVEAIDWGVLRGT